MKFTTLLPVNFSDGKHVPKELIQAILHQWTDHSGATPSMAHTLDTWTNPETGKRYRDENLRSLRVATS